MGHLPHLDTSSNLFHHTFQQERPPKVCLDRNARQRATAQINNPNINMFFNLVSKKKRVTSYQMLAVGTHLRHRARRKATNMKNE